MINFNPAVLDIVPEISGAYHRLKKELRRDVKTGRDKRDYEETCHGLDLQWWEDVKTYFGHKKICQYGLDCSKCICGRKK